jgi:hypothetical protein
MQAHRPIFSTGHFYSGWRYTSRHGPQGVGQRSPSFPCQHRFKLHSRSSYKTRSSRGSSKSILPAQFAQQVVPSAKGLSVQQSGNPNTLKNAFLATTLARKANGFSLFAHGDAQPFLQADVPTARRLSQTLGVMNTVAPLSESEENLQFSAVKYVRRHSMHQELWSHTLLGQSHAELQARLEPNERAIASGFISPSSWYIFTTRRVISTFAGLTASIPAARIYGAEFGNFKGVVPGCGPGAKETEVAKLVDVGTGQELKLEFETLYASMAPIYACKFWERRRKLAHRKVGSSGAA